MPPGRQGPVDPDDLPAEQLTDVPTDTFETYLAEAPPLVPIICETTSVVRLV